MRPLLRDILQADHPGRTYVIAEIGPNFRLGSPERDMALCAVLIREAALAGVDAVKFQLYHPDRHYAQAPQGLDYLGRREVSLREVVADLALDPAHLPTLAAMCRDSGLDFLCSAFSPEDLALVDPFVAGHKIASSENNHLRLLEAAREAGRPILLSTGASTDHEVAFALQILDARGPALVCLLQCTAGYPTPPEAMHLRAMAGLERRFGRCVGLSDHSLDPVAAPVAAVALGARVIEKHFTLDRRLPGPDQAISVTPEELGDLVRRVRLAEMALGDATKAVGGCEESVRGFAKRALHTTRGVAAGETLRENVNFAILRPGFRKPGLHPARLAEVEGRRASRDLEPGEGLREADLLDPAGDPQ